MSTSALVWSLLVLYVFVLGLVQFGRQVARVTQSIKRHVTKNQMDV